MVLLLKVWSFRNTILNFIEYTQFSLFLKMMCDLHSDANYYLFGPFTLWVEFPGSNYWIFVDCLLSSYTRWFKYDRDWFVCKEAGYSPSHIWTTLYIILQNKWFKGHVIICLSNYAYFRCLNFLSALISLTFHWQSRLWILKISALDSSKEYSWRNQVRIGLLGYGAMYQ